MTVYDDQIQSDEPEALVALAGLRAVGGIRFEELFLRGFAVLVLAFGTLVGTSTMVAESQHLFAKVLVKVTKVAWPNARIKIQQGSLSAVLMEYLYLQAPATRRPAFAQVVGFVVRPEPVQEHTLLDPAGVEQRLGPLSLRAGYNSTNGYTYGLGLLGFDIALGNRQPLEVVKTLRF